MAILTNIPFILLLDFIIYYFIFILFYIYIFLDIYLFDQEKANVTTNVHGSNAKETTGGHARKIK